MKDIQMFTNENFGNVRVIKESGKVLFVGSDVAKALGYAIPRKAITTHCKGCSKMDLPSNGWFRMVEQKYSKENGDTVVTTKTLVFQKGVDGIRKVIGKGNI